MPNDLINIGLMKNKDKHEQPHWTHQKQAKLYMNILIGRHENTDFCRNASITKILY